MPTISGTFQKTKKIYLTHPLTNDLACQLGIEQYYQPCCKSFDLILRTLDAQIGQPLMLTNLQIKTKEYEDIISDEIKAKLDLFRTCIAAIPRLLSDPLSISYQVFLICFNKCLIALIEFNRNYYSNVCSY